MSTTILTTKRLIVREFTPDDAGAYYTNNQDDQTRRFMPNHAHATEQEARDEIDSFIVQYAGPTLPCHWAIVRADGGGLIGHIGIGASELIEGALEPCCAISRGNRGQGYAAEAVAAFVPWCKAAFGTAAVYASNDPRNIASHKTLLKAGFILKESNHGDDLCNLYVRQ